MTHRLCQNLFLTNLVQAKVFILTLVLLSGCAVLTGTDQKNPMSGMKLGMTVPDVTKELGEPEFIARKASSLDRYYYVNNYIDFKDGKVAGFSRYHSTVEVSSQRKLNPLEVGMSRAEVVFLIGQPHSRKAIGTEETLVYSLCTVYNTFMGQNCMQLVEHWVIFDKGQLVQFGRAGDFNSAAPTKFQVDQNINVKKVE